MKLLHRDIRQYLKIKPPDDDVQKAKTFCKETRSNVVPQLTAHKKSHVQPVITNYFPCVRRHATKYNSVDASATNTGIPAWPNDYAAAFAKFVVSFDPSPAGVHNSHNDKLRRRKRKKGLAIGQSRQKDIKFHRRLAKRDPTYVVPSSLLHTASCEKRRLETPCAVPTSEPMCKILRQTKLHDFPTQFSSSPCFKNSHDSILITRAQVHHVSPPSTPLQSFVSCKERDIFSNTSKVNGVSAVLYMDGIQYAGEESCSRKTVTRKRQAVVKIGNEHLAKKGKISTISAVPCTAEAPKILTTDVHIVDSTEANQPCTQCTSSPENENSNAKQEVHNTKELHSSENEYKKFPHNERSNTKTEGAKNDDDCQSDINVMHDDYASTAPAQNDNYIEEFLQELKEQGENGLLFEGEIKEDQDFKSSCLEVLRDEEFITSLVDVLAEGEVLADFMHLIRNIESGVMPTTNMSFLTCIETAKWHSLPTTTQMRFRARCKQF